VMVTRKNIIGAAVLLIVVISSALFFFNLKAVADDSAAPTAVFAIPQGTGFRQIAQNLYDAHLIRSPIAFELFALLEGRAFQLKPGSYRLNAGMDTASIISAISGNGAGEAMVTIPEGSNIYEIDKILSDALVISPGTLIRFPSAAGLEGKLFPDTYQFYTDANIDDIVQELTDNFNTKAAPILNADPANEKRNLIIASLLEKEVPAEQDQQIVAGIILKRLAANMPLDIDATVCYAKLLAAPTSTGGCYPLTPLDFKINSPYNTYLYKGLPPGPIGNPGVSALTAALHPQSSPYWYYLSDPKTGKTIFAKTLDEQNQNRVKYLESN
jgi:UPF0755 protein